MVVGMQWIRRKDCTESKDESVLYTSQKKFNYLVVSFKEQNGLDYPNFTRRILFSLRSQMYKYP